MERQEKNKKISKKTNSVGVRFNKEVLEMVKKDRELKTPQAVLSFFEEWYKQTYHPIAGNPVMERNSPAEAPVASNLADRKPSKGKAALATDPEDNAQKEESQPEGDGIKKLIERLEAEIAHPPKFNTSYGLKNYKLERQKLISELKNGI